MLYDWLGANSTGHPCLVLPTGAGKSHIIAALCKDALQNWPETRILMLTHVKELIEQNAEKMRQHWPNAPMGIYSAGLGHRQLGEPITFAGVQSVRTKAPQIGHVDLVIIDECHLVGHKDEGGYRTLLAELTEINPALRIIGLTATPYRLGHGLITDKPAIFDALIEPVTIEELVSRGFLARLRSKVTGSKLGTDGVKTRGGDYIEAALQAAVDTDDQNAAVVDEVIRRAEGRKSWLFFCCGVSHAKNIADLLTAAGVTAECITGDTPKAERAKIIDDFRAGRITALTNANVLTTGFDAPNIDLIAMLRPTLSPGLYVQMAGRGLRLKGHTDHCLVLDFAGAVERHGPITSVTPPDKTRGDGAGDAPSKTCEACGEIAPASAVACPACGAVFPRSDPPKLHLRDADIMGDAEHLMDVSEWDWRVHTSKASGKKMIKCTYYGAISDAPVTEYFCVWHEGYAGEKAARELDRLAALAGRPSPPLDALGLVLEGLHPRQIKYKKEGKFFKVVERVF